ncbi:hypothetical protein SPRG_20031 [Saprolegnia parasitica CBS 223.65]|uniref:Tc3 transposase DNA binding domain-containing protein n=1 Tax=Saprolegnia parasitica (strain CBS 223.65) TaxID=695850 RepID=A0A067CEB3_SAPPC|nr:hypothetical protein SPRG_20031 [Saprolegnia parasitica CBS 223.65]KDO28828.1 hypothetical protein SPRG_20031 [Saprolegnia parasitica CBS 223.65]|eukprot:XP_012200559.1 hypothetical protein SPRG_20031 [Saprolegnia parasitica CBS 223.65]
MPRGTILTPSERESILALSHSGLSNRAIAKQLRRSPKVVNHFLKDPDAYNTAKRPGRKPKLSAEATRRLVAAASEGIFTARQLRLVHQVPLGVRRIQQIVSSAEPFRSEVPNLTPAQMRQRVLFAKRHLEARFDWSSVIFSDEKTFYLNVHQIDDQIVNQTHQLIQPGASITVWGAFAADGTKVLAILDGKQDAMTYCRTLQQHLLSMYDRSRHTFQHDNAVVHASRATAAFLRMKKVKVLSWPARSPDLSPIENVWSHVMGDVYADGRRYSSVPALRAAIETAWSRLSSAYLKTLVASMNKRCVAILMKRGAEVDVKPVHAS